MGQLWNFSQMDCGHPADRRASPGFSRGRQDIRRRAKIARGILIAAISLYVTSIPTIHCRAGESQGFYTSEDLQAAQKLYSSRVIGNFRKIILPLIQPEKANALRDVEFDFLLGVPRQELLVFLATITRLRRLFILYDSDRTLSQQRHG